MRAKNLRAAFTLIEVLVVLGILALLFAMLVPAVQRARDAAARTACANNLRQIALGNHQYHDTYRAFPAGMRWKNGADAFAYMSWLAQLLPYIEQEGLWQRTVEAYQQTQGMSPPYFPATGPHAALVATPIAVYACPADDRVGRAQVVGLTPILVAFTSYMGVSGTNYRTAHGILFQDSQVRLTDISDGTSQTLFAGERPPPPNLLEGWWYTGMGQGGGSVGYVLGVAELCNLDNTPPCPAGPYFFRPGSVNNQCDEFHYWSPHVGGANFAFADAGVRFLTYSASPLMPALGTRNGGEVVQLPEF